MPHSSIGDLPPEELTRVVQQPLTTDRRIGTGVTIDPFVFLGALVGLIVLFGIGYLVVDALGGK